MKKRGKTVKNQWFPFRRKNVTPRIFSAVKTNKPQSKTKILNYLAVLILLIAATLLIARLTEEPSPDLSSHSIISGTARIVDGDSLVINKIRIRLKGIDAPEMEQSCYDESGGYACGQVAGSALRKLIGDHIVSCKNHGRDRYKRILATCSVGDIELNRWMVENGHAVSYGGYKQEEAEAHTNKRGIWRGQFTVPHQWRQTHKNQSGE